MEPTTGTQQKAKPGNGKPTGAHESISRRVADELHQRIDQAAETGEKLEHTLSERTVQAQHKSQEVTHSLSNLAKDNPWAVFGGSVALGILIGALVSRR